MNQPMNQQEWEAIAMNIITGAGEAKSSAMEGLYAAKKNDFALAAAKLKAADVAIGAASNHHFSVIQREAAGEQIAFKVLFMHAEDQLLTTQTLILLVTEMVEMYRRWGQSA